MKVPKYVMLDKKRGETPLEAIGHWKDEHPRFAELRAAYAGRLDPMAEGKLLVLLGNECKKLAKYTGLDKEYVIEVLLDVSSDTGDVLGLADFADAEMQPTRAATRRALSSEIGTHPRAYTVFSSKTVNGKPLFLYALEGTLDTITIPTHDETIYGISLVDQRTYTKDELAQRITDALAVVPTSDEPSKALGADFRQKEIRARWNELFAQLQEREFTVLTLKVTCGSGAYMRTLADRLATSLETRGLALSINRTKIGKVLKIGPILTWISER